MNPFNLWLPMVLFDYTTDENDNFNFTYGIGLFSIMRDPTDRDTVSMLLYADISNLMLRVDSLSFQTTFPGFPLTLEFVDYVDLSSGDLARRITSAGLDAGFYVKPGRVSYGINIGGSYVSEANDSGGISAYEWKQSGHAALYYASFSVSNIIKRSHEFFGTGLSLSLRGLNSSDFFSQQFFNPRAEASLQFCAETRFPLDFYFYGAYDAGKMNLHGASRYYGDPLFQNHASAEYIENYGFNLSWLCGGEISLGLFSFEIQKNISHLYMKRFTGTLSIRNVLYDAGGIENAEGIKIGNLSLAQSLVLKLAWVPAILPIKASPFTFEVYSYIAWRFSNTITGYGDNFTFSADIKFSL